MTLFDHELTNYNYYKLTINNKSIDYELTIITYHKISLDLHRPPSFDRPFLMPAIFGTHRIRTKSRRPGWRWRSACRAVASMPWMRSFRRSPRELDSWWQLDDSWMMLRNFGYTLDRLDVNGDCFFFGAKLRIYKSPTLLDSANRTSEIWINWWLWVEPLAISNMIGARPRTTSYVGCLTATTTFFYRHRRRIKEQKPTHRFMWSISRLGP